MSESLPFQALFDGVVVPPRDELAQLVSDASSARVAFVRDLPLRYSRPRKVLAKCFPGEDLERLMDLKWPIRRHNVATLDAYLETCKRYQEIADLAAEIQMKCVFRGQWREYTDANGFISATPAAWRSDLRMQYELDEPELHDKLQPWAEVIEEMGVPSDTGLVDMRPIDETGGGWRFYKDRRSGGRVVSNPYLMALLMHYGFPTPSLDVTPDPLVAPWFALHRAIPDSPNQVHYEGTQSDAAKDPTVYAYLQPHRADNPVIELAGLSELGGISFRPARQSASALPFRTYFIQRSIVQGSWRTWERKSRRWPSAAIKIALRPEQLRETHSELTQSYLFPQDDPIYRKLLEAQAPGLCVYV